MISVEICIEAASSYAVADAVTAAYDGGASTVELCAAMEVDGLTPSRELVEVARRAFGDRSGLMVMVRPRAGNFAYSNAELQDMRGHIEITADAGADGVVLGALRPDDSSIDVDGLRPLTDYALERSLCVTFHRAFDAAGDRLRALEDVHDLGCHRVLTSGTGWDTPGTALDGLEELRRLAAAARGRVQILVGGGISAGNVSRLLDGLSIAADTVGVHAFSGARRDGRTSREAVSELVNTVREWEGRLHRG